jgi:hypothetical protein
LSEFQCDACGKRFRWKADLVGKRLRCPCGAEVQCPEHVEGEYDFAPQAPAAVEAVVPLKSSMPTLAYRMPPTATPGDSGGRVDTETLKNRHIPLWLLGGGAVIELISSLIWERGGLGAAMNHVVVQIVGGTVLMMIGVFLAAKIRGVQIGSFWTAALKLAAISVAPAAVGDLVAPIAILVPFFGGLVVLGVQFVLYFALLGALFDLEESDTWYFVWVIFFIDLGFFVLMRWVLSH